MALTGVEIFKLLPKTNCKKCGFPTCLAFAMKLAQRQTSLDLCPDVSDDARQKLGEASAPPVRPITFGADGGAMKLGEETVLFRHEKRFVNPCAFALEIRDSFTDEEISKRIADVVHSEIDRVGQKLRIDAIALVSDSGDTGRYGNVASAIASGAPSVPVILCTTNPQAAERAVMSFSGKKPIIHGMNGDNSEPMAAVAKTANAILGISGTGVGELTELVEKARAVGIEDIVLDSGSRSAKDIFEHNTVIRRSAVKKNFRPLGYPVITFAQREDSLVETLIASIGIAKYSSIIVLSSIEKWKNLALFTLRQNIYTDPQVPMQVEQQIYRIGEPSPVSPLFITTNFSLTYFIVSGEIENSKTPGFLAVMDCEGLSVLTAWAAGKFTASKIAQFIQESGVVNQVRHRELIIPGYVAILSGALEDKLDGWKITVGPREANGINAFLKARKTVDSG